MADEEKPKKKRQEIPLTRDVVIKRRNLHHEKVHESPLMTLQEIFEETDDKNRFVGDTMFWKYFEDIDCDRVKDTKSVEYLNLRIMFFETLFFIVLIALFTTYAYFMQNTSVYEARQDQLNYWGGCDTETGKCRLKEINNVESFWTWISNDFVPKAFTQYDPEPPKVAEIETDLGGFNIKWSPRFVGTQRANVLLGSIRLREVRIKRNEGCMVSKLYQHIYPDCYGKFSEDFEDKESFPPRFVPTYLRSAYDHSEKEDTMQLGMSGKTSNYPGGGFMIDLPVNQNESLMMIQDLKNWYWIDRATRAVVVEYSVLNTNVNVIVNNRVLFEFAATGSVTPIHDVQAAQVFFFTASQKAGAPLDVYILQIFLIILFIGQVFIMVFLMYKTCMNFLGGSHSIKRACNRTKYLLKSRPLKTCGKGCLLFFKTWWHYLRYEWNMMDVLVVILFAIHMYFRFDAYALTSSSKNLAPAVIGHPEKFMPISLIMVPVSNCLMVLAILSILIWVKTFKYLCMIGQFRLLVRILEKCAAELVFYSVLLLIVFFGFAVCFFIAFGTYHQHFSTISGSFLVLFFLLVDGYRVDPWWFYPGKDVFIPIVFFLYITFVYFVLLNVFLAIVLDVYAFTNHLLEAQRERLQDKENPMVMFIRTYVHWLKGVSLIRNEHEENMRKEDLVIDLELLPGLVRRKWIEKKRKMQRVADESFAGLTLFPDDEGVLFQDVRDKGTDWMLPNTRLDFHKMTNATPSKPISCYDIPEKMLKQTISRAQLQRLMDEDPALPLLLNAQKAVKVIQRFRKRGEDEEDDEDDIDRENEKDKLPNITRAQAEVFARIDDMERIPPEMEVPKVPQVHAMAEDMSHALTDVQNNFRVQLTGIIEATASLFEHLVELTQGLDAVRTNHEEVIQLVRENLAQGDMDASSIRSQ